MELCKIGLHGQTCITRTKKKPTTISLLVSFFMNENTKCFSYINGYVPNKESKILLKGPSLLSSSFGFISWGK